MGKSPNAGDLTLALLFSDVCLKHHEYAHMVIFDGGVIGIVMRLTSLWNFDTMGMQLTNLIAAIWDYTMVLNP